MSIFSPIDDDVQTLSPSPSPRLAPSPSSTSFDNNSRTFSGYSSLSDQSSGTYISTSSKGTSVSSASSRRRGYVRPQGASFAQSAKNRESVMSLGSIAHLQYYFARTGLLDGRSGQMVKKKDNGEYDIPKVRTSSEAFESPIDAEGELLWQAVKEEGEDIMHPPTVSTYRNPQAYVPPPPSQQSLKRELVEALENALQVLEASGRTSAMQENQGQGFYELEGLQILDSTTIAIRAARQYYTQHTNPQKLNAIKADSELRKELYDVLEVLKKAASRSFSGGFREDERLQILIWVSTIGMMIDKEAKIDEVERRSRKKWQWLDDSNWLGDANGRALNFLNFLLREAGFEEQLALEDTKFWFDLVDGRRLIKMHNAAVKKSKRQFHYVDRCHEDVIKPYRRAENVRFWLKAAELRFEIKLKLDVIATINATEHSESLSSFKAAVMEWLKAVRKDLTKDWNGDEERKLHARARSLALASPISSPGKSIKSKKTSSLVAEEPHSPELSELPDSPGSPGR